MMAPTINYDWHDVFGLEILGLAGQWTTSNHVLRRYWRKTAVVLLSVPEITRFTHYSRRSAVAKYTFCITDNFQLAAFQLLCVMR